jgi:hypothetical protein
MERVTMSGRRDLFKKLHPVELWIFFGQRGDELKGRRFQREHVQSREGKEEECNGLPRMKGCDRIGG